MSGQTRTGGGVSAVPTIVVLLALGFALRLIIAYVLLPHSGFPSDLGTFQAWGNAIGKSGPMGFYDGNGFHDYPPVYLYMLGILGFFTQSSGMGELVKLIPMLFDLALAVVVWKMAEEFGAARWLALATAGFVLINPVTWFNSAVWGQADSVGTVILLLGLWALIKDHRELATALAVTAVLTKPQLGILAILVGVVVIRRSLWPRAGSADPRRIVTSALAGALTGAAICLPFVGFHFDALQQEWSSPAGKLEAAGAILAALATFVVVLTSKSEWFAGERAAESDAEGSAEGTAARRSPDPSQIAAAMLLGVSAGVLFAGIRFDVIVGQMIATFGEYSYLTVNAYNPWALVTENGNGMATTLSWIHDSAWTDANGPGGPGFIVGPFATSVVVPAVVLALGLVVAGIGRAAGWTVDRSRAVAAGAVVVAAVLAGLLALGLGPRDVSVSAAIVGEASLLLVLLGTAAWAAWRDDHAALIVALAVLAIAFFVVPTRAHERYLFPFFGVGAILFAVSARWRGLYLVLIVANMANLLAVLTFPLYNGIPIPEGTTGGTLDRWLNDWGAWIRTWRIDSLDPRSYIVPVATVSIVMGLGFLWALSQLRPAATETLAAERLAAGRDPRFDSDEEASMAADAGRPAPAGPRSPVADRQAPDGVLPKRGSEMRAVSGSEPDA